MSGETAAGGDLVRVLLLEDFNTRIVVAGTMLLGAAAGVVGTFLLLRKRALVGDVISHATLPGVVLAFLFLSGVDGGKSLPLLLLGAGATALLAVGVMLFLRRATGLGEDAVMAITLGTSFGLGIVLLGIALDSPGGNQAGLEGFIYGKTASMTRSDLHLIAMGAFVVLLAIVVLFKEFRLLCFDEGFAGAIGRPVGTLDAALLLAVIATTLVGLQAVGLILVIALLVIPPSAARFWSDALTHTAIIAGVFGAVGCWIGVSVSASAPRLPAGALIVLAQASIFLVSVFLGNRQGILGRAVRLVRLRRTVARDHLLRAMKEIEEHGHPDGCDIETLLGQRSWSRNQVLGMLRRARHRGEVIQASRPGVWKLTAPGAIEASALVRNHRLWEQYLLTHAHLAASHVDRAADRIEHVLGPELVRRLEDDLNQPAQAQLASPHPISTRNPGAAQ